MDGDSPTQPRSGPGAFTQVEGAELPHPDAPAWVPGASRRVAFWRGTLVCLTPPGWILLMTAIGFGALARDAGLTTGQAVFLMGGMFAMPAQVLLVDQIARGASLAAAALGATLIGIRLLPMTVDLMPLIREKQARLPTYLLAVHVVAITAWLEGRRRLPLLPADLRMPHHLGMGAGMVFASVLGTAIGHLLAGQLPPVLAAALLFMTPLYFGLSLIATARARADFLALGIGAALGPVFFLLVPGFDLLATGVVGGTIAWLIGRRARA